MAKMFVTIRIMPESVDINFKLLREKIKEVIKQYNGDLLDMDEEIPIAFGLRALKLTFYIDESRGSDETAEAIAALDGVSSCNVIDMRRAVG